MTLSRKRQVRRNFVTASGTATSTGAGNVMVDVTVRSERAFDADPEIHEIVITGVATSSIEDGVHHIVVHIGRTSTHPTESDAGVRVRQVGANPTGLPFSVRIKALRLNPGDQLGVFSFAAVELNASSVHRNVFSIKDVWTELD